MHIKHIGDRMLGVVNGVAGGVLGSNETDDVLTGGGENNVFFVGRGTDTINGGGGQDVLNVDGEAIEWNFETLANGSVVMTHPTWGTNTLTNVESIFFARSGDTLSIADAIAATAGLPTLRVDSDTVLNGTPGSDNLQDVSGLFGLYGGVGNDTYQGVAGNFSQVNYDGLRSEFTITENNDGSITISHPVWGTDRLTNIDALVFTGAEPGVDGVRSGDFEQILVSDIIFDVTPTPVDPIPVDPTPVDPTPLDSLTGTTGDDNIAGGNGADTINGGAGNDLLFGDAGNDIFVFEEGSGYDTIADFEVGKDQIDVSDFDFTSFNQLNLVQQNNTVFLYIDENTSIELTGVHNISDLSADDFILAASDNASPVDPTPVDPTPVDSIPVDSIIGTNGDDIITGGNGADVIFGQNGADNIAGGNGADTINGGAGNDLLFGDAGNDIFVFEEGSGYDTIADFEVGKDQIDLSAFDFDNFNDLNLVEQNNSVFIFIDENTSVELSNIDDVNDLSADDFIL